MSSSTDWERFLPWSLFLFSASGCAALIYEVVWLQQLQLVIGASAVSVGLLLAAYMGGLFLGSVAIPQLLSAKHHPLHLYAALELAIGLFGMILLFALPSVGRLYAGTSLQGVAGIALRGIMAAACLLPPTILMGATFPIIARCMEPTRVGLSRVGLLYGANIAGAVFGCLFAGFYLLRVHDLAAATYTAVAINALVALCSFVLGTRTNFAAPIYRPRDQSAVQPRSAASTYAAIAISGFCALGAQVVWTRVLSVLYGATVYTFSIILAVFLTGLGIGSALGSVWARRTARPRLAFGICQLALAISIAWTGWTMSRSLPYWPIDPTLSLSPWFTFQVDLLRTLWTILPATVLWGASFPLALATIASPEQDSGWLAGRVYGANTAGAIAGSLLITFMAIPYLGTAPSQQMLIAMSWISAIVLVVPLYAGWRRFTSLAACTACALVSLLVVSDIPWQVIAYGRRIALMMTSDLDEARTHPINVLYRGEGLNSSLVITDQEGQRIIYVNGNAEASNASDDMRLERMAGHIPASIHPDPHDVLIIGFGAGVTAGSFVPYPEIKKIVIAELEPLIPPASGEFFKGENYDVLHDPRTRVVYDDGRHYLLTTKEKFDVITADPVHLYVKGTSALYTKEYFEIMRRRLNPGGVVGQWLPLYDGDMETMKSVLATFFEVFPDGTVWSNHIEDRGYDLVLVGQDGPNRINVDKLQERFQRSDHAAVVESLRAVGFKSALDVMATYLGRGPELKPLLAGAQINSDRNLRLQYIAGFEINSTGSESIYRYLWAFRRFPEGLFEGSDTFLNPLRALLQPPSPGR
jgi:spermidine synthase